VVGAVQLSVTDAASTRVAATTLPIRMTPTTATANHENDLGDVSASPVQHRIA
jgi:hypothetical protein